MSSSDRVFRLWQLPILLLLGAAIGLHQVRSRSHAIVRVSECAFDLGKVYPRSRMSHEFRMTNVTASPLTIERVDTGADATASVSWKKLLPGQTETVRLTKEKLPTKEGGFTTYAVVHFKGIAERRVFTLNGFFARAFPQRVDFGRSLRGEKRSIEYEVHPEYRDDLALAKAVYDDGFFDVSVRPSKGIARVRVSLKSTVPYGDFSKPIKLKTDDAPAAEKSTVVTGQVVEPVVWEPQHVSLGIFEATENVRAHIVVSSPYAEPFEIRGLSSDVHGLNLKVNTNGKATAHELLLTCEPDLAHGPIQGHIRITTSSTLAIIQIPVYGLFRTASARSNGDTRLPTMEGDGR